MRPSGKIVEELMTLTAELWDSLESEGTSMKGRILEITSTDQYAITVCHYSGDKAMVLRRRMKNLREGDKAA